MVQSLWKTVWQSLGKLNIHLPYNVANPTPKYLLKECPTEICTTATLFIIAKAGTIKCPSTCEWINKRWPITQL